ncbi:166_t:CDS:2, partial [Paraglomus occultum]
MGNQSVTGDFVGVSRETLARSLDEDEDLVDYEPDDIFITNEQPNTTMDVPTERIDEIDSMNTADASLQSRDHTQVSKEASESVRRRRRSESDTYEIDNREISRELDKSSLFDSSLSHSWRVDLNVIENRDQRTEILPITLNGRNADSSSNNTKFGVRYFIMKSHNHQNVQKSQNSGVWATQPINASILSEAFKIAERVVLIFSVNESRHFQGFGYMLSDVGTVEHASWTRVSESSLGGNFRVRWQKIGNLPFEKTVHIRNPWNENKPVKISRDGQELPVSVGEKLCQLFDEVTDKLSPIKDVDSKDELEDRSKMRRSNSTDHMRSPTECCIAA